MASKGYRLVRDPSSEFDGRWVNVETERPDTMKSWGAEMPDQPTFEISAGIPGSLDIDFQRVPQWSDLVLDFKKSGTTDAQRVHLTRNAGESVIEALHSVLHPWAGKNVQNELWAELDAVMTLLVAGEAEPDDKGKAQGLAFALALMTNPYAPNVDGIKALALERAGVEPEEDETDEMWDGLMPLGMVALQRLAGEAGVPKYSALGHDALVALLWTNDIGSGGPVATSAYWVEPEPDPTETAADDDDDWGDGL
jgi:hypothetical protein